MLAYRTTTGIDARIGRVCLTLNWCHLRMVPVFRVWVI